MYRLWKLERAEENILYWEEKEKALRIIMENGGYIALTEYDNWIDAKIKHKLDK